MPRYGPEVMRSKRMRLMLGIRRFPDDRRAGQFVNTLLNGDHGKFIGPARGLDRAVTTAMGMGLWTPEIEERTKRFADSFGILYAENYLQAANYLKRDNQPPEAQETLYNISLDAYRKLKRKAGQFFLLSYPRMLRLGQDPEQYLARVVTAKDAGGSLFAAKVARYLPGVIEGGGNPDEFTSAALAVRHEVSFKMSSLFMSLAPEMATEGEGRMYDYKDRVSQSVEVLGTETTAWALPAYVYLEHRAGINSAQTQAEIGEIMHSHGEKAAQWYVAGLRRIGQAYQAPDTQPNKYDYYTLYTGDVIPTPQTLDTFKQTFPEVLDTLGITAASFYSRTVEFTDPSSYKDAMTYSQGILGKSFFDKALWAIIKANNGVWSSRDVFGAWMNFNSLVRIFRVNPDTKFDALMDYAIKTAKVKKIHRLGLEVPRRSMSDDLRERYGIEQGYDPDNRSNLVHTHEGESLLYRTQCKWGPESSQ